MKTNDFERILVTMGFLIMRNGSHKVWANGTKRVVIPSGRQINRMLARRLLKEIGYKESVPEINYNGVE